MKVHIDTIGADGLDWHEPLPLAWLREVLGPDSPYTPLENGQLQVHLQRYDDAVHVSGRAQVKFVAACCRCLTEVTVPFDMPLDVTMIPKEPGHRADAGDDIELTEEDVGISTYENQEVDLACVVRDEVVLELPMRALCSFDCAGLCAVCGHNINESACGCSKPTDSRLSVLKQVKLKLSEHTEE
jgi:uncharacterized protein